MPNRYKFIRDKCLEDNVRMFLEYKFFDKWLKIEKNW